MSERIQTSFKSYRTKDGQTWEVEGRSYLLTEMSEGERNALMLATIYKSTGDAKNLTRYEERIEEVTGMVCIVLAAPSAGGSEVLMKPK